MATIGSDVIASQLKSIIRNPKAAVRVGFDLLERLTDGEVVVVDASNPFAYALELGVIGTHYGLTQAEALTRRLYSSMAKTQEDLYIHMADTDYLDRFHTPSETVMGFVMPFQDILGKAVPLNDGTGTRALVMPRHTSVTVGNYIFTLQYPIVIKVMYNNTVSVTMDTSAKTPTYTPVTNILPWSKLQSGNVEWVMIEAPMQQVKIISNTQQLTSFTGYASTFTFDDNFYYARAYVPSSSDSSKWVEISVTHQQQVYNPNKPTICLKVLNNSVESYIPQIYFQNGSISGSIRLDIYTTKGKLDEDLSDNTTSTNQIKFNDLDNKLTEYSTPFTKFTNIAAMTRTRITGGTNPITFSELLTRVTSRSAYTEGLPITNNQLGSALKNAGFDLNTTLDNVTGRQFTATRQVDPPTNATTVTGLGCSIQTIGFTVSDLNVNPIVFDSTKRATIKPTTLLIHDTNGIRIVDDVTRDALINTAKVSPDGIANVVNSTQYHYTPFHYVFDMSQSTFNVRPYYMTSPSVVGRYMFQQNTGMGLDFRSDKYGVSYLTNDTGYTLVVTLLNNASINAFKAEEVSLQLSYLTPDSSKRGWISGRLASPVDGTTGKPVDNKWVFAFDILTTFDINSAHQLDVTSSGYPIDLIQEFDILMIVKDYQPSAATKGDIDTIVSFNHIPNYSSASTYIAVSQEKMSIQFGQYLEYLWRRSRTIVDPTDYRRYENDVLAYYTKDVYKTNAAGTVDIAYDVTTGEIKTTKLHSAGDPIIDTATGNPVYRHLKGDIIYDVNGDPVPAKADVELSRQVDLFLVDGRYYFANNESTTDYLKSALDTIADWVNVTIRDLSKRCIDLTNLYYYPKASTGMVDVIVGDGTMVRLKADQSLRVVYTLRKEKYKNAEIRENLTSTTPATLLQAFKTLQTIGEGVLTKNDVTNLVKELLKGDIVDVQIHGFLNDQYNAVLLSDVSSTPTIGKKLVAMSNLTLQVQDDIEVDFAVLDKDVINPYTLNRG